MPDMLGSSFLLFAGTSHPELSAEVAKNLDLKLGKVNIQRFPDEEIDLQVLESVRGRDAFVLQTIALDPNNYLMELLILIDALKRASVNSVNVVIPYFGYCRQDRKAKPRCPITAKLVANLLEKAGATRVLTIDLHAAQVEGFFDIPVDNIHARSVLADVVQSNVDKDLIVVAPDAGSVKLARDYANILQTDFAVVDKIRINSDEVEVVTIIGDVKGKNVLLADDICSTASTIVSAAKACREKGAKRILAAVTHGLFVGDAIEKIEKSPIDLFFVSNTIPKTEKVKNATKIRYVSIASFLSKAIRFVFSKESVSSLTN